MSSQKSQRPYSRRSDIEKIESNWKKTLGFFERGEWSSVILRAATAAEIASNLVIREELQVQRQLEEAFVDNLLIWANGIHGKLHRLILPICKGTERHRKFKKVVTMVTEISKERNRIAHSGQFKKKGTAERVLKSAKVVIETLVKEYHPEFSLTGIKSLSTK